MIHLISTLTSNRMTAWEEYLKSIYFNPAKPGSFTSPSKLYNFVQKDGKHNISKYQIRKWLNKQEPYSLQKINRKPKTTPIIVSGIDDQWSADLMDMNKFSDKNDGYKYVLLVIDTFSKYIWLRSLKNKTGNSVKRAFENIFSEGRIPNRIRTDKGMEFRAKEVRNLMKSRNVTQMFTENENKASISERAIKTIKARIYRFFMFKNAHEYISELQNFADSYNHTRHSTIDTEPVNVTADSEEAVRLATYFSRKKQLRKRQHFKFKKGDQVRISHLRNKFTREYDQRWTGEIFTVTQRFYRGDTPIYKLKDYHSEPISGSFYSSELSPADLNADSVFKIEKVLKERGRGRNKEYLVKWLYWPDKFNEWIKADTIDNI